MTATPPIRLSDIAQRAETSVATVSLALAGNSRIGESTRQRIRELSQQMGYRPRRSFRSDTARESARRADNFRFGFLGVSVDSPVHATLLQALSLAAQESNIRIEILSIPASRGSNDMVDKACEFGRTLDGLIVMGDISVQQIQQI